MQLLLLVAAVLKKVKKIIYLPDTQRWRKCMKTSLLEVQQMGTERIFLCL